MHALKKNKKIGSLSTFDQCVVFILKYFDE